MKQLLVYSAAMILLSGCSEKADEPGPGSNAPVLSRLYRDGSMTAVLSVSETNIYTSGWIQLILGVQVPAGTEVLFPEIGLSSESFLVADSYVDSIQTLSNKKQLHRRTWILVPVRSGSLTLQPLEILAGSRVVETDPVAIEVISLLPPDLDSLVIRDISPPVSLLPEQRRFRQYGLIAAGIVCILILIVLLIRRLGHPKPVYLPSPQEAAFRALEALPAEPVACVHQLHRILKHYLEARHGMPASGKTAAELVLLMEPQHREKLADFLSVAEQMRFSNRVTASFAEESAQLIRTFIERNEQEDACG